MFSVQDRVLAEKEISNVRSCLEEGWLAPGKNAQILEKELAEYAGMSFGLMVNSRKSAILLAAIACGIQKDMKVLTSDKAKDCVKAIIKQIKAEETNDQKSDWKAAIACEGDIDVTKLDAGGDKIIIEDFGFNAKKADKKSRAAVVTFESLCSVILFRNAKEYNSALNMRDWGRAGTQDEDIKQRYSNFVLANVRYDWKFVFSELGFNFKSCEMSATLALDFFRAAVAEDQK
jgi:dTDP-4-amino-4,6-dideoxygalactose transaminase